MATTKKKKINVQSIIDSTAGKKSNVQSVVPNSNVNVQKAINSATLKPNQQSSVDPKQQTINQILNTVAQLKEELKRVTNPVQKVIDNTKGSVKGKQSTVGGSARGDDFADATGEEDYTPPEKNPKKKTKAQLQSSSFKLPSKEELAKPYQMAQSSQRTSYTFNPETISGTERALKRFNLFINDNQNDPWEDKKTKLDKKQSMFETSAGDIAKFYTSPQEFYSAYNANPALKQQLDGYVKSGGSLEKIAGKITAPVVATGGEQDTATYLANLTAPNPDSPTAEAEQEAIDSLVPERDIAQKEIGRIAGIADEHQKLYFGDEDELGTLDYKIKNAEDQKKLLEEKEKDEKNTLRERARYTVEKNNAELEVYTAEVERNRLSAKNYMTGMLAKLGALKTTGSAPLAIATLDQKYQAQTMEMKQKVKYANKAVEIDLNESINNVENDTDDKILSIKEDLTKSVEDIQKEVLKLRTDADKQIYTITQSYATKLRTQNEKYVKEAKAQAEKYAKEFAKTVSKNDVAPFTSSGNPTSKSKVVSTTEKDLQASRGADGFVNSAVYIAEYEAWIEGGGTTATFLSKFPPKNYVNPDDPSLPPVLQYKRPSTTEPAKKASGRDSST